MYQQPEIANLLAQSVIGDWSAQSLTAELRKTDWYQNELYPGIAQLYDRTADPEGAWKAYNETVSDWLQVLGVGRDEDGSFRSTIGNLLDHEVDSNEFNRYAETYQYAVTNEQYLPVFKPVA